MRRRLSDIVFPIWLAGPLMVLGLLFVCLPILYLNTWFEYLCYLAIAAVFGVWSHRRYRVHVERPAEGLTVTRVEDRKHYKATDAVD